MFLKIIWVHDDLMIIYKNFNHSNKRVLVQLNIFYCNFMLFKHQKRTAFALLDNAHFSKFKLEICLDVIHKDHLFIELKSGSERHHQSIAI